MNQLCQAPIQPPTVPSSFHPSTPGLSSWRDQSVQCRLSRLTPVLLLEACCQLSAQPCHVVSISHHSVSNQERFLLLIPCHPGLCRATQLQLAASSNLLPLSPL